MNKISEIYVEKEISRTRLDKDRNRFKENLVFSFRYNPIDKDVQQKRSSAKIIDVLVGGIISFFIIKLFNNYNWDFLDLLSLTIIMTFIINSILENLFGKSVGKYFRKIRVIDDLGNSPSLLKSFKRNFLSLVNVLSGFQYKPIWAIEPLPIARNIHNELCKTYVINDSKITEIKDMIIK